jgi:hypothetical protein
VLTAIENHGEGSFCVAFQTPLRAIEWASDVQNALLKAAWPEVRPNSCISHHTHTHTHHKERLDLPGGIRNFSVARPQLRNGVMCTIGCCSEGRACAWASTLDGPRQRENPSTSPCSTPVLFSHLTPPQSQRTRLPLM